MAACHLHPAARFAQGARGACWQGDTTDCLTDDDAEHLRLEVDHCVSPESVDLRVSPVRPAGALCLVRVP